MTCYTIIAYLWVTGSVMSLLGSYIILGLMEDEGFSVPRIVAQTVFWPILFPAFILWSHLRTRGREDE